MNFKDAIRAVWGIFRGNLQFASDAPNIPYKKVQPQKRSKKPDGRKRVRRG